MSSLPRAEGAHTFGDGDALGSAMCCLCSGALAFRRATEPGRWLGFLPARRGVVIFISVLNCRKYLKTCGEGSVQSVAPVDRRVPVTDRPGPQPGSPSRDDNALKH